MAVFCKQIYDPFRRPTNSNAQMFKCLNFLIKKQSKHLILRVPQQIAKEDWKA